MSQCHPSRLEQSSCIKIRAPYIDGDYSSPDFAPYADCNGKVGYAHCLIPFISFGHVQISPLLPTPNVQVPYIRKKICLTQVSRSFLFFEPLLIDKIWLLGYHDQCPPNFSSTPWNENGSFYGSSTFNFLKKYFSSLTMCLTADELLDGALFSWPFDESTNGYDTSFSFLAESNNTEYYSSISPRSDRSGMYHSYILS